MAQVFEFHFNPKGKENTVFDSFCYEPENIYERKLGNLYIVGELSNVVSQNSQILNSLAQIIKREYYVKSSFTPEQSLRESLKKANEFLSELSKKGEIGWLGNLNFAILSIKDFVLSFTKVGKARILLVRNGSYLQTTVGKNSLPPKKIRPPEILDIGQNLEFQDIEPYPLKIFSSIAVGKLAPYDKIIILTRDIFEFFSKENLLKELALCNGGKEATKLFKMKEKILKELSGICLLIILEPETQPIKLGGEEMHRPIVFKREEPSLAGIIFSYFKNFIFGFLRVFNVLLGLSLNTMNRPLERLRYRINLIWQNAVLPNINKLGVKLQLLVLNKNLLLILALILLLWVGSLLFR